MRSDTRVRPENAVLSNSQSTETKDRTGQVQPKDPIVKILMVTHYFGSHRGGIETVAERLFFEFAALQQEVVWVASDATPTPGAIENGRSLGIPVFNFVEKRLGVPFPVPTFTGMRRLHNEVRNADLVILHDCLYLTNIFAFLFAYLHSVPVTIVQHIGAGAYTRGLLSKLMKAGNATVTRPMLRRANQVVFISETTRDYFGGLRFRSTPAVIFNGVDTSVFRQLHLGEKKAGLRRALGLAPERPVILFVGRFVEWKGLPVLKRMVEMESSYSWVFAGWGPIDPTTWKSPNVYVFSELQGSALAELYRASDVFVLPSLREGFPVVIQEALASGIPVVCGSETATADSALKSFVTSVNLIDGDDEQSALACNAAISHIITSEASGRRAAAERRNFVLSRYSWRRAAERYLEIASTLVPESRQWHPHKLRKHSVPAGYGDSRIEDEVAR